MDIDLIEKMKICELKDYLKIRVLKLSKIIKKKELVARVFFPMENKIEPLKTAVEIETDLKMEYSKKLKIEKYQILKYQIEEDEGMPFWPMLLYPDICSYLMSNSSELGSDDLRYYKQSKEYSYYKSGWLKPLL